MYILKSKMLYPHYQFDNILHRSPGEMASLEFQRTFGEAKTDTLPRYCRKCEVRNFCCGECLKHRDIHAPGCGVKKNGRSLGSARRGRLLVRLVNPEAGWSAGGGTSSPPHRGAY